MTFFLIAFPAACFGAMVGLFTWGLCRAAAIGDRHQGVDPGAGPLRAPGSADLQTLALSRAQGGDTKGRPGRTRTASRPDLLSLDSIEWDWKRWE